MQLLPRDEFFNNRAQGVIFRRPTFEFVCDHFQDRHEQAELKAAGFVHFYWSPTRPPQGVWDGGATVRGWFFVSKTQLTIDEIITRELIPYDRTEQAALALEFYREKHGDKPVIMYRENDGHSWQGAVITPSVKAVGRYQVSWFDKDGFSGDCQRDSEIEAVKEAILEGFRDFAPNLLDTAVKMESFHAGNAATLSR